MAQPIAPDDGQQFLFPPALEDWVPADHPARFRREFVEQLDRPALGLATPAAPEGRPPYALSLLLKIWLDGYFQRLRSTRKLEAACSEPLWLPWLAGRIAPDPNSPGRFWRDHEKAPRAVCKQTVRVALHGGAVGLALPALDGTQSEAAASGHSGWIMQATPPKPARASNASAATAGTLRCAPLAPVIPKTGSWQCGRTPRSSKRCASD